MSAEDITKVYDAKYVKSNFFMDRRWLYGPFIKALCGHLRLARGQRVLDVGCGQGFFTALFAEQGMRATGVDISGVGIANASEAHGNSGARFEVGDARDLRFGAEFDLVYSRSCSLYNSPDFATDHALTDRLLQHVAPGGTLVIDYFTRLSPKAHAQTWRFHTLEDARQHFAPYPATRICYSMRLECRLFGSRSFGPRLTRATTAISKATGMGGELLAFVPR